MPKKEDSKRYTSRFPVRFTKGQRKLLNVACGLADLPLSAWLRTRAIMAARAEMVAAGKPVPTV